MHRSNTQETMEEKWELLVMKIYQKDKKNCLKNKKRDTLSGYKDHPNLDLNLKTHCALKEKLDSLKLIKITDHLDFRPIHVGRHSKILFKLESIKIL